MVGGEGASFPLPQNSTPAVGPFSLWLRPLPHPHLIWPPELGLNKFYERPSGASGIQ